MAASGPRTLMNPWFYDDRMREPEVRHQRHAKVRAGRKPLMRHAFLSNLRQPHTPRDNFNARFARSDGFVQDWRTFARATSRAPPRARGG